MNNQDLINEWKQYLIQEQKSDQTIQSYPTTLLRFNKFINDKSFIDVDKTDLRNFILELGNDNTRSTRKGCLRSFYYWLLSEKELIEKPIIEEGKWPRIKIKQKEVKIIEKDQVIQIFKYLDKKNKETKYNNYFARYSLLFYIIYYTGIRREELSCVRIEDFNFENHILKIPDGKGDKERFVPYNKELDVYLNKYFQLTKIKSGYLFPSERIPGNHINKHVINVFFNKIKKDLNIENSEPHSARRTAATTFLYAGASTNDIQEFLGHSDPSTTMKYLRKKTAQELGKKLEQYSDAFVHVDYVDKNGKEEN